MFSKLLSTLRTNGLGAASLRAGEEGAEDGLVMSARREAWWPSLNRHLPRMRDLPEMLLRQS